MDTPESVALLARWGQPIGRIARTCEVLGESVAISASVPWMTGGGQRGGDSASDDEDVVLVRAIANGDRTALARLYDRHASVMLALGIRIVRDRREAEDLLHDVFLEVWRCAKSYDPNRGRVRTWLVIRMRSRALDVTKSARVARRSGDAEAIDRMVADDDIGASPDRHRVRAALGDLTPDQRQVLELGYFEGLSASQISDRIGIPIGTVKSRLAAALTRMRQVLGPKAMARREVTLS